LHLDNCCSINTQMLSDFVNHNGLIMCLRCGKYLGAFTKCVCGVYVHIFKSSFSLKWVLEEITRIFISLFLLVYLLRNVLMESTLRQDLIARKA